MLLERGAGLIRFIVIYSAEIDSQPDKPELNQALVRLNSASSRERDARRAADGYHTVFLAASDRWRAGAGSLLDLEDTRRTAVGSRTPVLTVQRERVAAWISLYRAVGSGWLASEPLAETLP